MKLGIIQKIILWFRVNRALREESEMIHKKVLYLEWATLEQLMTELNKRGFEFIFSGHKGKELKMYFGTEEYITPVRLASEIIDTCLIELDKNKTDDRIMNLLTSVSLILNTLFCEVKDENSNQEE
jgi:hypothetical protein